MKLYKREKLRAKKKLLILSISAILLISLLTGCNFTNLIFPDDSIIPGSGMYEYDEQFVAIINQLTTPKKIVDYMDNNITYKIHNRVWSPYEFYLCRWGDCADYSNFAAFVAHYHGYQAYQIRIFYYSSETSHRIAAYKMGDSYTYSDNSRYINESFLNFREIVINNQKIHYTQNTWSNYIVYSWDFSKKIIEEANDDSPLYALRDTGPAGGLIFYDKGSYSDGWRYLEAAPASTGWKQKYWGSYGTKIGGTEAGIGTGQSNTTKIVTWLNSHSETGCAAQLCDTLTEGGYSDWFLPSIDELYLIYKNLYLFEVGGFYGCHWSSTESGANSARCIIFFGLFLGACDEGYTNQVRAVRAF